MYRSTLPLTAAAVRLLLCLTVLLGADKLMAATLPLEKGSRVALIGNGLGSRMIHYGHFETELYKRFPELNLVVRNLCDEGNTPGFRPHSGRPSPWAFPGAEQYHDPLSDAKDRWGSGHSGRGHEATPDEWLTRVGADIIVAFFGFNESFGGPDQLDRFRAELEAFIEHTLSQNYNSKKAPQLALVSPIAFEDFSLGQGMPDGSVINANLALYAAAMEEVTKDKGILFINLFAPTKRWFDEESQSLTRDGALLNDRGYAMLAPTLVNALFGAGAPKTPSTESLRRAVLEKNWMWRKYYKIPNGVHVFGRRHRPFGPDNYPHELKKLEELTANRDRAVWATLKGDTFDLQAADQKTHALPEIETNYKPSRKNGTTRYLYGDDALASFTLPEGYAIDLFASEREFPELANPVQMSFDNRGRLWIATMPTYPHYEPGDPKPNDKLLILEDTNNDGKADKLKVFADNLHLPTGFELSHEGVYVAQGNDLILLKDFDADDRADEIDYVLGGFDDHDTHHVISAFCADPSGAIYMGEGTFLHSHVETAYGPVRSSNGGFFRYQPQRHHLERTARLSIPNPWGTAVDAWGQDFFTDTSDPNLRWMLQGSVAVRYGEFAPNPPNLIENAHRVRPTSGLEFVSSRHFPDDVQGDILINNTIGFLGTKQHRLEDDGTGYSSQHRQDLVVSSDGNFRPVDMEFAPDGSLYLLDWHNVLVGHMQHSALDPLRDHAHGRVYRITYPSRPLVKPPKIYGASIPELLNHLALPESRARYRIRRELRGYPSEDVASALFKWLGRINYLRSPHPEPQLLEALWVTWGLNRLDLPLLGRLLKAEDYRVRAAAVRVLRYNRHAVSDQAEKLREAAADSHGRVRLEAIAAASWLAPKEGLAVLKEASRHEIDEWIEPVYRTALAHLQGQPQASESTDTIPETALTGSDRDLFIKGAEIYRREGHCITCHQEDGKGLPAAQFPPLAGTQWVNGSPERLIKLTLNGLLGPIEVNGKAYAGQVPMTAFRNLSDEEIASVLTYVRNSFGNEASAINPEKVADIREATKDDTGFYDPAALLEAHPE